MAYTALIDGDKYCSRCQTTKPCSDFSFDKNTPEGLTYWCKECASSNARMHYARKKRDPAFKRAQRNRWIKRAHGITLEEYEARLLDQGQSCAICGVHLPMEGGFTHLDHDHETGELRGFLCTNCNRGLGHFQDSVDFLTQAMEYLNEYS